MEHLDFTREELDRMDDMDNAAFEFIKVVTEQEDMEWDISLIGDVLDMTVDYLAQRGFKIRWPAILDDENGEKKIQYYN